MSYKIGDWVRIKPCKEKSLSEQIGKVYEIIPNGKILVRLTEVGFPFMGLLEEKDIEKYNFEDYEREN